VFQEQKFVNSFNAYPALYIGIAEMRYKITALSKQVYMSLFEQNTLSEPWQNEVPSEHGQQGLTCVVHDGND